MSQLEAEPTPSLRANLALRQRGRAEMEFLQATRAALRPLFEQVESRIRDTGVLEGVEPGDIERLRASVDPIAEDGTELPVAGAIRRWTQRVLTPRATAAMFENSYELLPLAEAPAPNEIEQVVEPGREPTYWQYEFHGTSGGWDVTEVNGFVHHELVYRYLLAPLFPGDIFAQREQVAACAPQARYERICDLGCGTGQYTAKLAARFPEASITGIDLSMAALRYAQRRAADTGEQWQLVRTPAERTGLPDKSFDLVTSYILLHELPTGAIRQVFEEAHRLLVHGGDLVMADVAPYRVREPYTAWLDDWIAQHANEPWWRGAATIDLAAVAADSGFIDVEQRALGSSGYPWVTIARKP